MVTTAAPSASTFTGSPSSWQQRTKKFTFYFVVLLVFFLSGVSGLIYQVCWQRLLTLYYGVGPVSTSIVVSIFLAGLGLGALLGGYLAERITKLILAYQLIELAIGAIGLASLYVFPKTFALLAELGLFSGFLLITAVLLIPTILMGMTLPIVVKILNGVGNNIGHSLSLLYFVNTLGAAIGSLLCAYVLISFFGLDGAIEHAAIINFLLAVLVGVLFFFSRAKPQDDHKPLSWRAMFARTANLRTASLLVFLTGFLAIGYQILWFRVLTTLLKPSAYVFPTVLAVYLLGIAVGSVVASIFISRVKERGGIYRTFCALNGGISLWVIGTFVLLMMGSTFLPFSDMLASSFAQQLHPPYHPMYAIKGETLAEQWPSIYLALDVLIWPLLLVFPATILMGASFPVLGAFAMGDTDSEGMGTGLVYALSVLGNVLGAVATGFVLLPTLGTELTLLAFALLGLGWFYGNIQHASFTWRVAGALALGCVAVVALLFMPGKAEFYAHMHPQNPAAEMRINEGVDSVVVSYDTSSNGQDQAQVYISGSPHASYPNAAYQLEAIETIQHATRLANVLVIGFGGGDLTQQFLQHPGVERVTTVEISQTLIANLSRIPFYSSILNHSKLELVVEDARRFLLTQPNRYDVIVMDPLRSTTAYSNNIYSHEFFQLLDSRMHDHSVLMVWMNEYKTIPKTLAAVFPQMQCYYYFCLSSRNELVPDPVARQTLIQQVDSSIMPGILLRTEKDYYDKGGRPELLARTKGQPINTSYSPISEYYIGLNMRKYWRTLLDEKHDFD